MSETRIEDGAGSGSKLPAARDDRLDQVIQAMRLMIETQNTHSEMLAKLIELATPSGPGPLEVALAGIAEALHDQTGALERIGATLDGLGEEVEAGVMRGLATALGDEAVPEDNGAAEPTGAGNSGETEDGSGRREPVEPASQTTPGTGSPVGSNPGDPATLVPVDQTARSTDTSGPESAG